MLNTPEIRIDCPDALERDVVERAIAPGRATRPALVLRCEAGCAEWWAFIRGVLEAEARAAGAAGTASAPQEGTV